MNDLLRSGLAITIVGMGLVFAGLALLWGVVVLLGRLFPEHNADETTALRTPAPDAAGGAAVVSDGPLAVIVPLAAPGEPAPGSVAAVPEPPTQTAEVALTAERARVAALVAGALLANALPMLFEVPTGPAFEHGRTAPLWVAANRARALPSWQPARRAEADRDANLYS